MFIVLLSLMVIAQSQPVPARLIQSVDVVLQPGGQTEYIRRPEFEALFGGVAGPGKSWALVFDACGFQFKQSSLKRAAIESPGYRAVLFRRKSTELGKLLDEAHRYYPHYGGFYAAQRRGEPGASYTFPCRDKEGDNIDAKIFFCHLEHENHKHNHDGFEYEFIGFDELAQFSLTQYLYLFSRCRSKVPGVFARVRSTAMPVGSGLVWVRKRFITNGLKPGETGHFLADIDPTLNPTGIRVPSDTKYCLSRIFIPGKLSENKYADPLYPGKIKAMGKVYEKAMLGGDWEAFGGDFMPEFDRSMVIDPFDIPKDWRLTASLDPGFSNPCSFSLRAVDFEGHHYRIATYYEGMLSAPAHAKGIKDFIESCPWTNGRMPQMIVAGKDAWAKRDRFAVLSNELTFADAFQDAGLILQPASTDRIQGWWAIRQLMERKRWFVFKELNQPFLEELVSATRDPKRREDIKGRGLDPEVVDHALDDERYGTLAVYTPDKRPEETGWASALFGKGKKPKGWKPGEG